MTYTIKVTHEDGLKDYSTTRDKSSQCLALAFVIYKEKVEKHPNKSVILTNDIEYKKDK